MGLIFGVDMKIKLKHSTFHKIAMIVWILLIFPTVVWWRESILWIAFMSIYAVIFTHHAAYEGSKAKEKQD